jgi:hypothetical protein
MAQVWLSTGAVVTAIVGGVVIVVPFNGEGEDVVHPAMRSATMPRVEKIIVVLSM